MDVDVKKVLLTLLETQKTYVREDREKYGTAMVVFFTADNESQIAFPEFQDEATKIDEYTRIVGLAKRAGAVLMITVNAARTGRNPSRSALNEYRWGDYDESNSDPCILLTASGFGLETYCMEVAYTLTDGDVIFEEPEVLTNVEVNLLPDWPESGTHNARPI